MQIFVTSNCMVLIFEGKILDLNRIYFAMHNFMINEV